MRTNNFIWPSPMPGINPDIREAIYKPTREFIQNLDGMYYSDMSSRQKQAVRYLHEHGKQFGVTVSYASTSENGDICSSDSDKNSLHEIENDNCIVWIDFTKESETLLLNLRLDLSDSATVDKKPAAKTGFIVPMLALTFFVKITALLIYIFFWNEG